MARNDYFVIAYRILAYLYDCLKKEKEVFVEYLWEIADLNNIGQGYFEYIIRYLNTEGYINGVYLVKRTQTTEDGIKFNNPMITPKGIEFLQENSAMAKARDFLKTLKESIPGL